ncbi:tyrosyl-trna synthetase [Fusarium longipes]|uniref:Tyrosine--tRNA ligase n=1 Tax=Fusarium longipes TaxID=694270 RepID=A0A395TAA0_9HYPO|nr:tyrosyl-trna synthetase [Fusarium longipes]
MTPEESLKLIKANLAEILNPEIIDDVVLNEKRPLSIYWGTAPTGKPHCGYFVPMVKIAELLQAGCHVKVLIADVHGYLDSVGTPIELTKNRTEYYQFAIKSLLRAIGVSIDSLEFVIGSSFQWTEPYNVDCRMLEKMTTISAATKASAEVVKQGEDPVLGGLTYPIMQALDEQHLEVDAELGGVDQRKIFTFALENLPKLGYKKRAHLMNALVPGLGKSPKMSSSEEGSKIGLLDTPAEVEKKIKKAVCAPRVVDGNGVIAFIEHVIFRILALKGTTKFVLEQRDGESLVYDDIVKFKQDYEQDILTPQMIKAALSKTLNELLQPIREEYEGSEEWQACDQLGYPPVEKPAKKKKKKKQQPAKKKRDMEKTADTETISDTATIAATETITDTETTTDTITNVDTITFADADLLTLMNPASVTVVDGHMVITVDTDTIELQETNDMEKLLEKLKESVKQKEAQKKAREEAVRVTEKRERIFKKWPAEMGWLAEMLRKEPVISIAAETRWKKRLIEEAIEKKEKKEKLEEKMEQEPVKQKGQMQCCKKCCRCYKHCSLCCKQCRRRSV